MRKFTLMAVFLFLSVFVFSCSEETDKATDDDNSGDVDMEAGDEDETQDNDVIAEFCPPWKDGCEQYREDWSPVEPKKEQYEHFQIVWLKGTPKEMGRQHAELLKDEIKWAMTSSTYMQQIKSQLALAKLAGLLTMAETQSYPDIVEECEGMVEISEDDGWDMDMCLAINFGDVLMEHAQSGIAANMKFPLVPGCSQVIAAGDATSDGRLYHARILDWAGVDVLAKYPTIFVRQPDEGIPHVYIGFPGNLSPYSGINAAGISIGSNEANPSSSDQTDDEGRSHVQMVGQLLKNAHSFDEAESFLSAQDHMSTEALGISDGVNLKGAALEMSAKVFDQRNLTDDIVYLTNHFVGPTGEAGSNPYKSSTLRYERLKQLIEPDGEDTLYGSLNPEILINKVMRDTINPYDGSSSDLSDFDNDSSLATNGAVFQIVFDSEKLLFWVAAGEPPVPSQPFLGFSLSELLGLKNSVPVTPEKFD